MRSASSARWRWRSTGGSPPSRRALSIRPSTANCSSWRKLSSIASRAPGSRSALITSWVTRETSCSSSRGSPASGSSMCPASQSRARTAAGEERCSSPSRWRNSRPSSGAAMHIESSARSRRSRAPSARGGPAPPHPTGAAALQHLRRVLADRHRRHPQPQLPAPGNALRPQHRRPPRPIRVQREHHLLGVPRELLELIRGDRRPHHRHRLLDPRLVRGEHIRVSLDHHGSLSLRDRAARPIDPVQRAALPVELALRRVQVLRLRVGSERACAEPLHPPAPIAHREDDPRPEPVVVPSLTPLLRQARREQLRHRVPRRLPPRQHLIPRAWRVPHPESSQDFLAQPPSRQVLPRLRRLLRLPQIVRVELGRSLEHLAEPDPPPARLLRARVVPLALHLDPVTVAERLHRLRERQPFLLLDELDHVAPHAAPEAVVELLPRIDRERRCPLLVERAQPHEALARAPQVGVRGDDLDDVGGLLDAIHRLRRELAHTRLSSGSAIRLNVAMQNRSVIPAT